MNIVETVDALGTERQDQQEDHIGTCEKNLILLTCLHF